jgi:hypothetical protein
VSEPAEPPRYFTLIDAFRELFAIAWIAVGCYAGWKIGGTLLAMFVGGVVGRVACVIFLLLLLRPWASHTPERGDPTPAPESTPPPPS